MIYWQLALVILPFASKLCYVFHMPKSYDMLWRNHDFMKWFLCYIINTMEICYALLFKDDEVMSMTMVRRNGFYEHLGSARWECYEKMILWSQKGYWCIQTMSWVWGTDFKDTMNNERVIRQECYVTPAASDLIILHHVGRSPIHVKVLDVHLKTMQSSYHASFSCEV